MQPHKIILVFSRNSMLHLMVGYMHPGEVFHPDFQHGQLAYFDISICSITQPVFISRSASWSGVAAAAGEVNKDEKHLETVLWRRRYLILSC